MTPEGIIVQSSLGDEDKRNTELEPKFKNKFRDDTIEIDNTKYILSNLNELVKTMKFDTSETLRIKELNLDINCEKDSYKFDYDRGCYVIQQVLRKINDMNLLSEPLKVDDICDELYKEGINTQTTSVVTILERTLQMLNHKVNFKDIPELNDIHVSHILGEKCILPSQQYFIHCIHASDIRFLTSPESDTLDMVIDRQYHRNQYSKKPIFIMPKEMIQELKLPTVDSVRESIIKDSNVISMAKDEQYRDIAEYIHNRALGHTPIEKAKTPYEDLTYRFQQKYGHIPHILPQISVALNNYFNGHTNKCVDTFNYKRISKIQGAKTPIMIKLSSAFDWNRVPMELQQLLKYYVTSANVNVVCKYSDIITEFYYNAKNKDLLDFMNVLDKIPNEAILNLRKKLNTLDNEMNINEKNQIRADIHSDIRTLISFTQQQRGLIDARQAEKEYEYSLINNSSAIRGDNTCIMSGSYKAYFLNSLDSRHFSVGYDTSCCQHMGGAGEECVIAATSSPHCGTFIIESDGVIKAQAFVWESLNKEGNRVLVLDNIEFANDRDATDYLEILYGFCKESPYENIHMGLSYNVVSHIGRTIDNVEYIDQPPTIHLDDGFYSDYNSVVSLKTNGQMEFDVADAKYYIHNFETPTILESSTHCINQTKDSLVAQHYDEVYDIESKTTMVFTSDGTKKESDTIYPIYPFDSTTPSKYNYMMKWNDIQPSDIAITITHIQVPELSSGQYIIKPISFDGKEIITPNVQQCNSLYKVIEELRKKDPQDLIMLSTFLGDVPIQSPMDFTYMSTENYLSSQTNSICYDELAELKKPDGGDSPKFGGDDQNFGGDMELEHYEERDYADINDYIPIRYNEEEYPEEDEEELGF